MTRLKLAFILALAAIPARGAELRLVRTRTPPTRSFLRELEGSGVRITHVLPDGRLLVLDEGATPVRLPGTVDESPFTLLPDPASADSMPLTESDVVEAEERGTGGMDTPPETSSPVLAGDVVLGLVLPESDGRAEASLADWAAEDLDAVVRTAIAGTLRFVTAPGAPRITFHLQLLSAPPEGGLPGTVGCAWEARSHPTFNADVDRSWLASLGYLGADLGDSRRRLARDLRDGIGADAAYVAVVVNDRGGASGRPVSMLGGPEVIWYLSSGAFAVFHETAHAFGAVDEYCPDACRSPASLAGNALGSNGNSRANDGTGFRGGAGEGLPCMMMQDTAHICVHTRSQLGWDDLDGNGSADPMDVLARTELDEVRAGADGIHVHGRAAVAPLLGVQAVGLADVAGVDVRVARGPWMEADPVDGTFDSPVEEFALLLPGLPDGSYAVEVRARTVSR